MKAVVFLGEMCYSMGRYRSEGGVSIPESI